MKLRLSNKNEKIPLRKYWAFPLLHCAMSIKRVSALIIGQLITVQNTMIVDSEPAILIHIPNNSCLKPLRHRCQNLFWIKYASLERFDQSLKCFRATHKIMNNVVFLPHNFIYI